jgi:hypothetical protein
VRPRPWRHVPALKALVRELQSNTDGGEDIWAPARQFFEQRKAPHLDLGDADAWHRWSEELDFDVDDGSVEDGGDAFDVSLRYLGAFFSELIFAIKYDMHASPTLHLPHLLRVLGPSSLTLYKHVLGRRRILIYTQPPVEAACFFCQVAADMCFEDQTTAPASPDSPTPLEGIAPRLLKGKHKEGINVLGIVTLHDMDMLERESRTGRGWIACTTDALFLEKPQHYDLVIDLTTYASERLASARPGLQLAIKEQYARRPTYRLSSVRFTWSDVKLVRAPHIETEKLSLLTLHAQWTELERILQLDEDTNGGARAPPAIWTWTDAWGVYEDVCLVCARLCSCLWRNNGSKNNNNGLRDQWSWTPGSPRTRARRERRAEVRARGEGIEGRPASYRRRGARTGKYDSSDSVGEGGGDDGGIGEEEVEVEEDGAVLVRSRQTCTTLALLQTFHAQTRFLLSRLATVLPPDGHMTPRDLVVLELGPLSALDARFVEWLAEEYVGAGEGEATCVVVRRGWRDLLGGLVGAAVGTSS